MVLRQRKPRTMNSIADLERRLDSMEDHLRTVEAVLNKLMEDIYEPEFLEKIDKLAEHGIE